MEGMQAYLEDKSSDPAIPLTWSKCDAPLTITPLGASGFRDEPSHSRKKRPGLAVLQNHPGVAGESTGKKMFSLRPE